MKAFRPGEMIERFWSRVNKTDGCWLWTGNCDANGYGMVVEGSRSDGSSRHTRAHRFSYELAFGPLPSGVYVCHRCDNPPCCNPAHLFAGTQADNMADCIRKGRVARGGRHPQAKLREADIPVIRARLHDGEFQRVIAADYGVTESAIQVINVGKRWRHVS